MGQRSNSNISAHRTRHSEVSLTYLLKKSNFHRKQLKKAQTSMKWPRNVPLKIKNLSPGRFLIVPCVQVYWFSDLNATSTLNNWGVDCDPMVWVRVYLTESGQGCAHSARRTPDLRRTFFFSGVDLPVRMIRPDSEISNHFSVEDLKTDFKLRVCQSFYLTTLLY